MEIICRKVTMRNADLSHQLAKCPDPFHPQSEPCYFSKGPQVHRNSGVFTSEEYKNNRIMSLKRCENSLWSVGWQPVRLCVVLTPHPALSCPPCHCNWSSLLLSQYLNHINQLWGKLNYNSSLGVISGFNVLENVLTMKLIHTNRGGVGNFFYFVFLPSPLLRFYSLQTFHISKIVSVKSIVQPH